MEERRFEREETVIDEVPGDIVVAVFGAVVVLALYRALVGGRLAV
jgi:hypothetical protein